MNTSLSISYIVSLLLQFYFYLIIIRVFLSWIPSIDWEQQPFAGMRLLTDPLLNIFRGIIPPIGGALDISPIIALILLQIVSGVLVNFLYSMGL